MPNAEILLKQTMAKLSYLKLSRRERQIMDVLYQRGTATAAEIQAAMPSPPSYSAVRAKLRILEEKGYISHAYDGPRYVYTPIVKRESAEKSALTHLLDTFYDNSVERAMTALFKLQAANLSEDELNKLARMIELSREKKS